MPDFENLKKALWCRGEPDKVPLFELSVDEEVKARFLGRPAAALEDEVEFCMRAGYDFVPVSIGLRQTMRGETSGLLGSVAQTGVLKPVEARYSSYQEGPRTRLWAEEGRGVIRDRASLESFAWPHPDSFSYDTVSRLGRLLPEGAKLIANVGYIFSASWMLMGMEAFCIALGEGSSLVVELVRRVAEIQKRVVENLLQFDCVGAVCMPDDLAHSGGLLVDPRFLRQHVFPCDREIGERVRARGLPYLYHSDGRVYSVIDDLIACGFQALHPCERSSMDIARVKRQHAGRLCVCGNIDLDTTLCLGTPADVEAEVKERIRTLAPGGGYCCGSSNSVTEYVPFENYLAMVEAVKRYGGYPIGV
jgi:uroporphyrinogen decarboxylase